MILIEKRILFRQTLSIFSSLSLIWAAVQFPCTAQNDGSAALKTSGTASNNNSAAKSKSSAKTPVLYGRIEQIAGGTGAQFPILKEQTAKLDTRLAPKMIQKGQATAYSGSVIRSFPQQFNGTWGGHLKIWSSQMDPICWQLDADEANGTKQLLVQGREGTVNFNFTQTSTGKIELEPARLIFMVPMKDTNMQKELNSMLGAGGLGQAGGLTLPGMDSRQMANVMQQMANNMNVPVVLSFGAINNTPGIKGVSGNQIKAVVLSNTIRQLSPSVLEQQIVSQETQRNKTTGNVRQEYAETVFRFTSQNADTLYVQAAAVNYTSDRKFERKLILYGTVRKGQVMQEAINPMGGMGSFPGMTPGNGQMPQFPGGQNPLQDLLR